MYENRLELSLLLLRLGVFVVMIIWSIDKFVRPEHAAQVYQHFYFSPAFGTGVSYLIGIVQLVLVVGFVLGVKKTLTYGAVFVMHAISTLSSYKQYLAPYADAPNILFFAAWPMLAACIALFLLRDRDTLWTVKTAS